MESTSSSFMLYTTKAIALVKEYKFSLLSLISLPLIRTLYIDYRGWYGLGAGGIPHNFFGWVVQGVLSIPASRDLRSTTCFEAHKTSDLERQSYLEERLPQRDGRTAKTAPWCIPHRQLGDTATGELKQVRLFAEQNS